MHANKVRLFATQCTLEIQGKGPSGWRFLVSYNGNAFCTLTSETWTLKRDMES